MSEAIAADVGITYRQLDHWVRRGYLNPRLKTGKGGLGYGYHREWPESELAVAAAMGRLVRLGLDPGAACRVARSGREGWAAWALGCGPVPLPNLL